jgi:6-phosphogluconolactonase
MRGPSIQICNGKEELAEAFAAILASGTEQLPEKDFFSLALSGGSTPRDIFHYLASGAGKRINWSKVRIFWGDERCVPPDHADSNFRMAKESLFISLAIPSSNIFRIKGENDPETEAGNYETLVREMVPAREGIPRFDLFMLGLGDDGHTASIFPDNIAQFSSEKLFIAAANPYNQQIRVSATGTLINKSRNVVFIVTGAAKAERVAQIVLKKPGWEYLPASQVKPEDGKLTWMLDADSAQLLKIKNDTRKIIKE